MFINILLIVAFVIATYTDLKSREIPLWLFPGLFIADIIINGISTEKTISAIVMAIPFFILCIKDKMGGGDLIMFTVVGFILGVRNLLSYLICLTLVSTIYIIVKKNLYKELPIAPFAASGYLIYFIVFLMSKII